MEIHNQHLVFSPCSVIVNEADPLPMRLASYLSCSFDVERYSLEKTEQSGDIVGVLIVAQIDLARSCLVCRGGTPADVTNLVAV